MNVIILVAVRLKSKRLKKKAMLNLYDKPLIVELVERLRKSYFGNNIILCTSTNSEDDNLQKIFEKYNIEYFRGHELDVMSRFIHVAKEKNANTVIRVTGDNPLTDYDTMDKMIESHLMLKADYTFTEDIPHGTRSEVISTNALIKCHNLIQDKLATEYMTWMLNRSDHFKVNKYIIQNENLKRPDISLTVDTENDYKIMKKIFTHFKGKPPHLIDIIKYYDSMPKDIKREIPSLHLIKSKRSINAKFKTDD